MNAANQRRLTPFLVALAVLLALLLLLLFTGMGRKVHWGAPRALAPLPPAGNPANLPKPLPLQHFAEVWQAPLFNPNRKPVAKAAADGSNLGDLELTGVILTPGMHMALLHDKKSNKEMRLKQGESLPDGSITLVEVHARSALFDTSGGRTELQLPAGAPIDPLRDNDDGNNNNNGNGNGSRNNSRNDSRNGNRQPAPASPPAAVNGVHRVQPTGNTLQPGGSERSGKQPASAVDDSSAGFLKRLRRLKQKQQQHRGQGDAATHSKE